MGAIFIRMTMKLKTFIYKDKIIHCYTKKIIMLISNSINEIHKYLNNYQNCEKDGDCGFFGLAENDIYDQQLNYFENLLVNDLSRLNIEITIVNS